MRKLILISIYLLSISQLAQAALFDDKEARQKIVDLQQKTDVQNQATQASLDALKNLSRPWNSAFSRLRI